MAISVEKEILLGLSVDWEGEGEKRESSRDGTFDISTILTIFFRFLTEIIEMETVKKIIAGYIHQVFFNFKKK